jgi:hypothetical protein
MICGTALQTLLLLIVLSRTNWNKEVRKILFCKRILGGDGHCICVYRKVENKYIY